MSVRWMTWAWDQQLPMGEKFVLVALADHAGEDGTCWPSSGRLRQKTGLGRSTILRNLASLEEKDLLWREARFRDDGGQTSSFIHLGSRDEAGGFRDEKGESHIEMAPRPGSGRGPSRSERAEPSREPSVEPSGNSLSPKQAGELFEKWWALYLAACRITGSAAGSKGAALREWMKLTLADKAAAADGMSRHRDAVIAEEGRYVMPNGSTWLHQKRWMDDTPLEPPRKQNTSPAMDRLRTMVNGGPS